VTIEEIKASGLLELYALGQLSVEEAKTVEGYLTAHPALQDEFLEIQNALEIYARSTAIPPSAGVRQKILDEIKGAGSPSTSAGSAAGGSMWRIIALVLTVVAIGLIALLSQKHRQMQESEVRHQAVLDSCDRENQQYFAQVERYSQLAEQGNEILHMTGTEKFPQTDIYFYHNPESKRNFIQVRSLPAITANQSYQLWSLKPDTAPIPLDVFQGTDTLIEVRFEDASQSYAITIEPLGGQASPTLENLIGIVSVGG
jgi:anti-sigma-K factor RskA